MEKSGKGFTLVELMIVVAIVGILAAIAIPSFSRLQLRSKFAELKTNVAALQKSEYALRQAEREICLGAATGSFAAWAGGLPAHGAGPGTAKLQWNPRDHAVAIALDWAVQGSTYGQYFATVGNQPAGGAACSTLPISLGLTLTLGAVTDLDGDAVLAQQCAWSPQLDALGAVSSQAPACPGAGDTTACGGANQPSHVGSGEVATCSSDSVL